MFPPEFVAAVFDRNHPQSEPVLTLFQTLERAEHPHASLLEVLFYPDLLRELPVETLEPPEEDEPPRAWKICGGVFDIRRAIIETHAPSVIPTQRRMKMKTLGLFLGGLLVNGDSTQDPRQFDGLRKFALPMAHGGGGIDSRVLDEAIAKVPGANALVMSKRMRNVLTASATRGGWSSYRNGASITWDKNEFGMRIAYYEPAFGPPIPMWVTDYDDGNTQVIDSFETADGKAIFGGDCTSIYVVRLGADGVCAVQEGLPVLTEHGFVNVEALSEDEPLFHDDLDTEPSAQVDRLEMDWYMNLEVREERGPAAVRLHGILAKR